MPRNATWLKDSVTSFSPGSSEALHILQWDNSVLEENQLTTASGDVITYDHLVIAMGLQLRLLTLSPFSWEIVGLSKKYGPLVKKILEQSSGWSPLARYEKIKGLPEAFDTPGVGSNYR